MPVFYNRSTGKQEFVPESEALEKLESTHGVPLEELFQITAPDGSVWDVPGKNLDKILRQGGRFSTQEEVKEVDDRHKYGEGTLNELKALGLGVARGATLNLSDIAFAKTGLIEAETIKGLEKYNPAASITGEITGNIAGLAIPGATPVKLAAKLGRAVETGITGAKAVEAGAQASRAAKILRSGVGIGAGSAIEAAAYGVGEYVSETALGDPEANAEKILAAATLGGTVGIGFRVGGAAFSKGKEFLTKSKKPDLDSGRLPVISPEDALSAKNTVEELSGLDAGEVFTDIQQKMARMSAIHAALQAKNTINAASQGKIPFVDFKSFFNVIGTASQEIGSDTLALSKLERKFSLIDQDIAASADEFIKPTMGQRLVGMAASVTGADQAAIKEVINNPELIRLAQMSDADWYKRALEFRDIARDVHKSMKTLSKSIVFEMKPQKVREVLADVDLDVPQAGALQYFEAVRKSLREMDADSNIYKDTGTVASLKKILRNALGQSDDDLLFTSSDSIVDMVNAGTLKGGKFFEKRTAADVFLYLDEFKRDTLTGEINKKILSSGDLSSLHHDILRTQLRVKADIYDNLANLLENDKVFPVMGTWQQRVNKDISAYMDALDFFEQKFMQDQGGKYVISTDRIKSFLRDPKGVRFISSGSKFEAYEGFKNAQPNIIKLAEELFPESKKLEAAKIAQKGHEALDETIKKAEAEREIRSNAWNGHLAAHTELTPEGREAYRQYVDKAQDVIALKEQKKIGFKADGTPKEAPKPKAKAQEMPRKMGFNAPVSSPAPVRQFQDSGNSLNTFISVGKGDDIPVQWKVVELRDLQTSHSATGEINSRYPQELQARDRGGQGSNFGVSEIVKDFNPRRLLDSATASDGAPVVDSLNNVVSGNGRTLALGRVYQEKPSAGAQYKEAVKAQAQKVGLNPAEIDSMKHPVLVRVLPAEMKGKKLIDLAEEANLPQVAPMGAVEQALIDVKHISDDFLTNATFDTEGRLKQSANLTQFAFNKLFKGLEKQNLVKPDGGLNSTALRRLETAMVQKAYENKAITGLLSEEIDSPIKRLGNVLLELAPSWAKMRAEIRKGTSHDLDITENLTEAAQLIKHEREDGGTLKGLWEKINRQSEMFSENKISPETKEILGMLFQHQNSGVKIREALQKYMDEVGSAGSPKQGGLFGAEEPESKIDLLKRAFGGIEKESGSASFEMVGALGAAGGLGMLATDYLQDQQALAEASSNPESLINALSENLSSFGKAAPKTTALVQQKAWQAMQFLQEKAPSNPLQGQYLGVAPKWRPSDQELARFERYLNATDNPLVILEELRAGTVHTETVETVKTLYPLLYQQIQEKMLEALSNRAEPLPPSKSMVLSKLLGVPGDPTTQPKFIAHIQAMHMGALKEHNEQQQIKQSQKNSRLAESSSTRFQTLSRS